MWRHDAEAGKSPDGRTDSAEFTGILGGTSSQHVSSAAVTVAARSNRAGRAEGSARYDTALQMLLSVVHRESRCQPPPSAEHASPDDCLALSIQPDHPDLALALRDSAAHGAAADSCCAGGGHRSERSGVHCHGGDNRAHRLAARSSPTRRAGLVHRDPAPLAHRLYTSIYLYPSWATSRDFVVCP
jgi:hypothetical protein